MLAVVTGSAGFIGRRLVAGLNDIGWSVLQCDLASPGATCKPVGNYFRGPMPPGDARFLLQGMFGPVVVFHFGAVSSTAADASYRLLDRNVHETTAWAQFCAAMGFHLVFAGSAGVYGNSDPRVAAEASCLTPYARSKWAAEEQIRATPRLDGCILRLTNVYGPGEEAKGGQAFIHRAIESVYGDRCGCGEKITIYEEDPFRDWVYVDDVVDVCIEVAKRRIIGTYDLGCGSAHCFTDVVAEISRAFNYRRGARIRTSPLPDTMRGKYQGSTLADLQPLLNVGINPPRTPLREGVARMVNSFKATHPDGDCG